MAPEVSVGSAAWRAALLVVSGASVVGCASDAPNVSMKLNSVSDTVICGSSYPDDLKTRSHCYYLPIDGIDSADVHEGTCVVIETKVNPDRAEYERGISYVPRRGSVVECLQ